MKIAIISDTLLTGGAERQILISAVALTQLGHQVELITYYPQIGYTDIIHHFNLNVKVINKKGFLRISRTCALARYLRKNHFDVVHAFKGTATIFTAIAARLAAIKVVFGGFRSVYNESLKFRTAHRAINIFLEGWIVNSEQIKNSMVKNVKISPEKIFVVYNGISAEAFQTKLSVQQAKRKFGFGENQPVITQIARLAEIKNYPMFLKMASFLLKKRRDIRFLIAGDGPLKEPLERQARSLGVSDAIVFLGNRDDIADILAATDISVLTSDSEGFPNTLIEAMSVGIPVVCTDYSGVDELIVDGKFGLVVPKDDPEAMAAKVMQLLDDSDLRHRIGSDGMRMVNDNLSPAALAKNLVSIYESGLQKIKC